METPSEHLTDSNDLGDVLKNTQRIKSLIKLGFGPCSFRFPLKKQGMKKLDHFSNSHIWGPKLGLLTDQFLNTFSETL